MTGPTDAATRYSIVVESRELAWLTDLVNMSPTSESTEYRQPSSPQAGPTGGYARSSPASVTLKYGTGTRELLTLAESAGQPGMADEAKTASLVMLSRDGRPAGTYLLTRALPTRVEVGDPRPGVSGVTYGTVILTCESIERLS